jgi:hypothetical protein
VVVWSSPISTNQAIYNSMAAINLVIPEKDSSEGYEQEIELDSDGLAAAGFYPQTAKPGDLTVGIERDTSSNLILKDPVAGTYTLAELVASTSFDPNRMIMETPGNLVYIGDGDICLKQ